jgi:hypothetical protein
VSLTLLASYGEQGVVVLHQTLRTMFPKIPPLKIEPLSVEQFFLHVLVPEAAAHLIREDMNISIDDFDEAYDIMEKSRKYGMARFPDHLESDANDIGPQIRALKAEYRKRLAKAVDVDSLNIDTPVRIKREKGVEEAIVIDDTAHVKGKPRRRG